jgi:hypothetical protein
MKNYIELTEKPKNYTGAYNRMEVQAHSPDIHSKPGVYLQEKEGCGYTVFELTPEQAVSLGQLLIQQAGQTVDDFQKKFHRKS